MALDAHVVSHTHWDREWYHPAERFQQRLVALVDELLDDPPAAGTSFLLDGQGIVVDDYLAIRPERAPELAALLAVGRLEAGPWYVLADELIPSAEAIVRNLLAGRRSLRRAHAAMPGVLYCPDSFGHPAALPSIAAGFGLAVIVLWRGYGGARWPDGDTARWVASNGDAALLYHLPRDGYEFGANLPTEATDAGARWLRMRGELASRATTGVVLITNGADHHARQRNLEPALDALAKAARVTGDTVRGSSLHEFAAGLLAASAGMKLAAIHGELRDSYGYTWTLQGTFATRAGEKRANAGVERLLLREAEPWSALAARAGAAPRPLLDNAWRTLLTAHPHDTLCGCSIDDVAAAMELRISSARGQAAGLRDDAIARLLGHDADQARDARERWTPVVVVRNPAARTRSGVALMTVEQFLADVPVGPGSVSSAQAGAPTTPRASPRAPSLGALQVLSTGHEYSLTEAPRRYPDNDLVSVARVAAWVSDIGGYAVVCHPIERGPLTGRAATDEARAGTTALANGTLSISVGPEGAVSMVDRETNRRIASLFEFVDEADLGDLYTAAPRPRAFVVRFQGCRVVHRGPLRAEIALRYAIVATTRRARTIADARVHLVLDAGASFLRLNVSGENRAGDHRIRFVLHTDVPGGDTWADAAFGPVRRERIIIPASEAAVEAAPQTAPLHRYVSRFSGERGATVFSDGLAEYESRDDGSIAVTLVRAVGQLSRGDILERPGHAGWPRPTPAAQCLGAFGGEFAVMLHGARTRETIHAIECAADDVLNPLAGTTLRSALHVPPAVPGVQLVGVGLGLSAIKPSEDGDWLVLRCVNLCEETVAGEWVLPFDVREARQSRLDETPTTHIAFAGRAVPIVAAPRDIVTILVR